MKIAFQIFVNFGLFPKELLLLPPFIRESVANLVFRLVPHYFLFHLNQLIDQKNPDFHVLKEFKSIR